MIAQLILALITAEQAHAIPEVQIAPASNSVAPKTGLTSFNDFITVVGGDLLTTATLVAGVLAVGFLIWYGIRYIMAGGNADQTKAARSGIVNSIIGIAIITAAFAIIRLATSLGNQISGAI